VHFLAQFDLQTEQLFKTRRVEMIVEKKRNKEFEPL